MMQILMVSGANELSAQYRAPVNTGRTADLQ